MSKQPMQNLTSHEGTIENIPKPHVAIISFTLKNQRVQAFFFTPSYYHNGQRIPNQQTPLTKFIRLGDTVHFDAVPNLKENSFNIRWRAVAVWKGSQKPKVLSSSVEHRKGHVIYVDDQDGLIKCSKSDEKCLFTYVSLFINNKRLPAGLSLKAFISEGEFVQFTAEPKSGTYVGHVYKLEAARVWKEDLDSFDSTSGLASFDDFHESDSEWISVESKKSKKAAVAPQPAPLPPVVQPSIITRPNRVFPQEMVSNEIGIATDVDFRRVVVTFTYGNNKERVLVVKDKFEGSQNSTLKDLVSVGDKVLFDCHLYDKPDGLDRCKWFATSAMKYTEEVKSSFSAAGVLSNQAGTVTEVSPSMGEVLLIGGEQDGERISFQNTVFLFNGKPLTNGMNLKEFLSVDDKVQIDAKWSDEEDDEGIWLTWKATAIWKGEKFTSYRAAVETKKAQESHVDLNKFSLEKALKANGKEGSKTSSISSLDIPSSYGDIFPNLETSSAISESSNPPTWLPASSNQDSDMWPSDSEPPWDVDGDKMSNEVSKPTHGFKEDPPLATYSFTSLGNANSNQKETTQDILETKLEEFKKLTSMPETKPTSEGVPIPRSSTTNTVAPAVTPNIEPVLPKGTSDTQNANLSFLVDVLRQFEQHTVLYQHIIRTMFDIVENLRQNIRLRSEQESFLQLLGQIKPFLDLVSQKNGENIIEKELAKNPSGLLKILFQLLLPSSSPPGNLNSLLSVNNQIPLMPTIPPPAGTLVPGAVPMPTPLLYDMNLMSQHNQSLAQSNPSQSNNRLQSLVEQCANGSYNIASVAGQQQPTPVNISSLAGSQQPAPNTMNLASIGGQQPNAMFNFNSLGVQQPTSAAAAVAAAAHLNLTLSRQQPPVNSPITLPTFTTPQTAANINLASLGAQQQVAAAHLNFASMAAQPGTMNPGLNLANFNAHHQMDGNLNLPSLGGQQGNPNINLASLTAHQAGQPNVHAALNNQPASVSLASLQANHANLNFVQASAQPQVTPTPSQPPESSTAKIADLAERLESIGLSPTMMEGTLKQLVENPTNPSGESISSALEKVRLLEKHLTGSHAVSVNNASIPFLSGVGHHLGVSPAPQHASSENASSQVILGTGEIGEVLKEDEGYLLWKSPSGTVEKVHFTRKVCFLMNIQLDKVDIRSVIKPGLKVDFKAEKITKGDSQFNWEAIEVEAK